VDLGLVMAACNLAGAHVGTWLALRRGTAFVRQAFLVVVSVLIAKLAWDMVKEGRGGACGAEFTRPSAG
jgi:uncharacterized membrane protein YfcA